MSSKEKHETYRLLKDADKYHKETEDKIFTEDDKEFTDYQFDLAIGWLKKAAHIKDNK